MTSESCSAVLDLKDDNDDENITGSTDLVPLIMEHGSDIAVKVDAPLKQISTLETYVTYRVRCVCARWSTPEYVRRRYNHFKELHRRLSLRLPWLAPPPLPPLHSARQQLDRYSQPFVAIRTMALDAFINRVAQHPILTNYDDFRIFLTTPDDEIDRVFKNENSALNLWGLGSALYGATETKPTNGARVKDPEFTAAAEYLQSLEHKLTTLCSLTKKRSKLSIELGLEYKNLSSRVSVWSSNERGLVSQSLESLSEVGALQASVRKGSNLRPRAVLPMLASYAAALRGSIVSRDNTHAAYVASNNANDDLHNKLEQASEALRSELGDWNEKTRNETKSILLEMADNQIKMHQQILTSWERALKMSTETNLGQLFKTVSKSAVQNLSPTKCHDDETEKDLDDLDICSENSDLQEFSLNGKDEFQYVSNFNELSKVSKSVSNSNEVKSEVSKYEVSKSEVSKSEVSKSEVSKSEDQLNEFAEVDLSENT